MKKVGIIGIISVLVLIVAMSGCTSSNNQNSTKTYNTNGVSFNYPAGWNQYNSANNITIAVLGDPSTQPNSTAAPNTLVNIQKVAMPSGATLKQVYDSNYAQIASSLPGYKAISDTTRTVDGNTAYVNVHSFDINGVTRQEEAVWLEKNGNIYIILCGANQSDFAAQQANFDMIINSFKVQ